MLQHRFALAGETESMDVAPNGFSRLGILLFIVCILCLLGPGVRPVRGQAADPLADLGIPPFSVNLPVENGWISAATGNLHLEIPMGSFPQRSGPPITLALVYDSAIWVNQNGCCWMPASGWKFVNSAVANSASYNYIQGRVCVKDGADESDTYNHFYWVDPYGNTRNFNITTVWGNPSSSCGNFGSMSRPTGDAFANDLSGYHMYVKNYNSIVVYGPDGTLEPQRYSGSKDTNGNYVSSPPCQAFSIGVGYLSTFSVCNVTDTLGRSLFSASSNGNTVTLNVLNSQGGTSTYTVTFGTVNYSDNFYGNGGASGSVPEIQSIGLPDGTSYQFGYDSGTTTGHYGQLTSVTLPTGAQATYSYSNFFDSEFQPGGAHITRGVSQRTTPDGTWTFNPAVILQCDGVTVRTGCKQQLTVTKPSYNGRNDNVIYKFVIYLYPSEGVFPFEEDYYNGAVSPSNLLLTELQTWDYSRLIASTLTLPVPGGTVNQTTQQCDNGPGGNISYRWEWNFYTGAVLPDPRISGSGTRCTLTATTPADRTTTFTYQTFASSPTRNIVNRPASITVTDKNGATVSQTNYSYDGSTLVSGAVGSCPAVTASQNHDDTNYGTGNTVRGNPTQVQQLISGSNYLTTSKTYDILGQVRTSTDSNQNVTNFCYADNFFNDGSSPSNPSNPPSPYSPTTATNAYLKTVTHPTVNGVTLTDTHGYYWGTGQKALSTDPNNETTYFHYSDPLNRPTSTELSNGGWNYSLYAGETTVDTGIGITSTTLSASCTGTSGGCRHDQKHLDGLGRTSTQILVSDPDGSDTVATTYDSNGRVHTVSTPYRSTSSPTDGLESYTYDGLDRKSTVTHADSQVASTYYGAFVSSYGGLSGQKCSGYGVGYPILIIDEAKNLRQTWTDGLGRLIEVDEPSTSGSLSAGQNTCYSYDQNDNLIGVTQGTVTRSFSYDMIHRLTVANNPEAGQINYYYTTTTAGTAPCSGDPSSVCLRVAPKENQASASVMVTTTYAYDALNRLISKAYSDTTPGVIYGYDAVNSSGCTPPTLTITNGKSRRTSMCDESGKTAWSYDPVGNKLSEVRTITSVSPSVSETISTGYNLDSSIASITYPSMRFVTYTTGNAQRTTTAYDSSNNYALGPSACPFGESNGMNWACYTPPGKLDALQNGAKLITTSF